MFLQTSFDEHMCIFVEAQWVRGRMYGVPLVDAIGLPQRLYQSMPTSGEALFSWALKSLQVVTAAMKSENICFLAGK